jgi:hypothetical protein
MNNTTIESIRQSVDMKKLSFKAPKKTNGQTIMHNLELLYIPTHTEVIKDLGKKFISLEKTDKRDDFFARGYRGKEVVEGRGTSESEAVNNLWIMINLK